jgi:hypothetical protein
VRRVIFAFLSARHFDGVSRINELLHDWVIDNTDLFVPPAKEDVTSPYDARLAKAGYVKDDDSDFDSDELFVN